MSSALMTQPLPSAILLQTIIYIYTRATMASLPSAAKILIGQRDYLYFGLANSRSKGCQFWGVCISLSSFCP